MGIGAFHGQVLSRRYLSCDGVVDLRLSSTSTTLFSNSSAKLGDLGVVYHVIRSCFIGSGFWSGNKLVLEVTEE